MRIGIEIDLESVDGINMLSDEPETTGSRLDLDKYLEYFDSEEIDTEEDGFHSILTGTVKKDVEKKFKTFKNIKEEIEDRLDYIKNVIRVWLSMENNNHFHIGIFDYFYLTW